MSVYGLPDIERLIRERDEARAQVRAMKEKEAYGREVVLPATREQSLRLMQHAEGEGYRKGVEDAAKVALNHTERYDGIVAYTIRKAILALLEQKPR